VTLDIAAELREHFAGYDDEPDSLEHLLETARHAEI
jgi:hypothetical protein